MLRFLRRLWSAVLLALKGAPERPYCAGCEAKGNEIAFLREHVNTCLDRILSMAGHPVLPRRVEIDENSLPEPPENPQESEDQEQVRLDVEAENELRRMAEAVGAKPEDFSDIMPFSHER